MHTKPLACLHIISTFCFVLFIGCGGVISDEDDGLSLAVDGGLTQTNDGGRGASDADVAGKLDGGTGCTRACGTGGACVGLGAASRCECDEGYYDDGISCAESIVGRGIVTELVVKEPAGVDRTQEVIRTGLPFPRGMVQNARRLGLFVGEAPVPMQTKVTSTWPDGSVRWVLITVQTSLSANQEISWSLRKLDEARPALSGIVVNDNLERVRVDTGPLQVDIPKSYGGVIDRIVIDGNVLLNSPGNAAERIGRGPYIGHDGATFYGAALGPASTPHTSDPINEYWDYTSGSGMPALEFNRFDPWHLQVVVEDEGPLHTSVRVSGAMLDAAGNAFGTFINRLHFQRGSRTFKVEHTLVYTGRGNEEPVQGYGFRIPFVGKQTWVEGEQVATGTVSQISATNFETPAGMHEGQALGTMARSSDSGTLGVVLRDMAENFPKALDADGTSLDVQLYPGVWELSRYSSNIDTDCFESGDVPNNRGAEGTSKTSTFWIRSSTAPDAEALRNQAQAVDAGPLLMLAPPQWYSDARVMGVGPFAFDSALNDNQVHFRIDRLLRIAEDFMRVAQRKEYLWMGQEDYGDIRGYFDSGNGAPQAFWACGRYGWSGNSGEPSNQLWVQFLRRPHRDLWLDAEALARHTLDLQMVHMGSHADPVAGPGRNAAFSVGSLHRHGMQPWSGYAHQPEYSHVGGIETYYYLSGDERARDALFEAAQFIARYQVNISMVNGIGVLSRAIAAFGSEAPAGWSDRLDALLDLLGDGHIEDELTGSSPPFGGFIRGMTGLGYHLERTHDAATATHFFKGAQQVLTQAPGWGVATSAGSNAELFHMNSVSQAADLAALFGHDPSPYVELAQAMLERNTHATTVGGTTHAIPLTALQNLPEDWRDWTWDYDTSYESSSTGILWMHRQLFFLDDNMQGYHSYRAFVHLAGLAATVPPTTPGLLAR